MFEIDNYIGICVSDFCDPVLILGQIVVSKREREFILFYFFNFESIILYVVCIVIDDEVIPSKS